MSDELEKVLDLVNEVAVNAALAPTVTGPMAPTIVKIVAEKVKHVKIKIKRQKALTDSLQMLKKISKITPPDFKKHRLQDPHRQDPSQANVAQQLTAKPDVKEAHKIIKNIPNTTHVNPNFPSPPKVRR